MTGTDRKTIAYYITAHGFGHAVRSLEVIRGILEFRGDISVVVVSDIPEFLVEQNVGKRLPFRRRRLDAGLVQLDSIRFDLEATRRSLEALDARSEELVADEVRFLRSQGIGAVVSDLSHLAFEAAHRAGVPSIGLGNFTWDWIYEFYARSDPAWTPLISRIRDCCRRCRLFLRLPMHSDCSVFPRVEDVPLVARKAARAPAEVRGRLGLERDAKIYLISFAALDLEEGAQRRLETIDDALFLYRRPLAFRFANAFAADGPDLSYADLVSAMDGVVTKPGYGIVADCLSHGTPMIYTDRGPFPEYEILVEEMKRSLATVFLPNRDLYGGNWGPAIEELRRLPRRTPSLRLDGASVCATAILKEAGWE
jgi:L-arabinokinase